MTNTESANAPPTAPGPLGARVNLPIERSALWATGCGALGLIVAPFALAGLIVGIVALRRLALRPGERQGHGLAIAGIVLGGLGIVFGVFYAFMIYSAVLAFEQVNVAVSGARLGALRNSALAYAEKHQGYPEHMALLATDQATTLEIQFMVVDKFEAKRRNQVTVGGYDFVDYDGSYKADQAVLAAVERIDRSAPVYRFGTTNFVRLAKPTNDPGIVFCWRTDPDTGDFTLVMDDGSTNLGTEAEWPGYVQTDAEARRRNGLPAIVLPERP